MSEGSKKTQRLMTTYGAPSALMLLVEGPNYPTKMARSIDIDRRAMVSTMDVLLELKLVERHRLNGQKRIKELYDLTPLGRKLAHVFIECRGRVVELLG